MCRGLTQSVVQMTNVGDVGLILWSAIHFDPDGATAALNRLIELNPAECSCTTVELACLEDSAQGELSSVLWEAELSPKIITEQAWDSIGKKEGDSRKFDSRDNRAFQIPPMTPKTTNVSKIAATGTANVD